MVTAPFSSMPAERPSLKQLAAAVVASIKAKGTLYDRKTVAAFQTAAKLPADGVYGPNTAAALKSAGVVPPALSSKSAPKSTQPAAAAASAPKVAAAQPAKPVAASPATSKVDIAAAGRMAAGVATNIRKTGAKYDRKGLASFQVKAGLTGDGVYGPLSESALKHFGAAAPKALFKGALVTYTPPA
jgi:peptidoglycan hydrolase-like protein with peptidoglycan-binding domain